MKPKGFDIRHARRVLSQEPPLRLFTDTPARAVYPPVEPDGLDQLLDDPEAVAWLMGRETTTLETTT